MAGPTPPTVSTAASCSRRSSPRLAELARREPVLLVVEDAHWADQATRDLLGFLFTRVRSERLAIVLSFRSDDLHRRHPLRRTLAEWFRLPAVTRIQLDPLTGDDVRELIRSLHADTLTDAEIDSIVDRADGNAFFAEELVAATEQCGTARHLPWQLADLLLVRLERLTDDAREAVRVAAVAGRRVDHAMLAEVADLPDDRLDRALRDAIDAHVLQLTQSGRGYTFRHALLAEAVYDDLLPGEMVRLHAAYARAVASRPDHSSAELARHARASHDLDTAYLASMRAGDEAMGVAAPQEALQHYEAALELAPRTAAAPADLSDLVVATVEAAEAAGHSGRGLRLARTALAALAPDAPDLQRARLLFALVRAALGEEIDEDVLTASSTALSLVPAEPPTPLRVRVLAQHAHVAFLAGRDVEAYRSAHEAIEIGERIGERLGVADARTSLAIVARRAEEPEAVLAGLRAVEDQARGAGDTRSEIRSSYSRAGLFLELGDLERAQDAFDQTVARAREIGRLWDLFGLHARTSTGVVRYARGDWDGALQVLDLGEERPPDLGRAVLLSTAALVRAGRGDRAVLDTVAELRPAWDREGRIALHCALAALEIYEQDGDHVAGQELADDVRALIGRIWHDEWPLVLIQMSAKVLAALTTAAIAAPQRERAVLGGRAGQLLSDGRTAAEKGLPVGRELGIEGRAWLSRLEAEAARLQWVTGVDAPDPDRHLVLWQRAADAFDYGNEAELARTRARLAGVLRAAGHAEQAAATAQLARTAARRMRADPLLRELRGLGDGGGITRRVRTREHWSGGTHRPRARCARPAGRGPHQPPDRRPALHLGEDGQRARVEHPGQAGRAQPCRGRGAGPPRLSYRTSNPRRPSTATTCTSTASTEASGGPCRRKPSSCSTGPGAPSTRARTDPSGEFATHPATPSEAATRRVVSRKKTPWTRPRTVTSRATIPSARLPVTARTLGGEDALGDHLRRPRPEPRRAASGSPRPAARTGSRR